MSIETHKRIINKSSKGLVVSMLVGWVGWGSSGADSDGQHGYSVILPLEFYPLAVDGVRGFSGGHHGYGVVLPPESYFLAVGGDPVVGSVGLV